MARLRADKGQSMGGNNFGKIGIFRQETNTRMHRIGTRDGNG